MPSPPRLQEMWLRVEDRVATLTLDRPQRRNALSPTMLDDLLTALRWCRAEPEVRVVVLTGAGETAFCAGAELGGLPGDSQLGRDSFYRQQDMEFRAALEHLHSLVTVLTLSEDSQEGLRAFLEKREPRWRGR